MTSKYLTVSQLTQYIKLKFDRDPYLRRVFVKGEISNYNAKRRYKNQYFSLKDDRSLISAVIFSGKQNNIRFEIEEGMSVLATGWISVYERNGSYQLYIEDLQPDGIGALYLAYEQLKETLSKEGLFRPELKKEIPRFPKRIGVITSDSGAVIEDIRTTVKRRYPLAEIVLFPTLVQGEKAAADIVKSINELESTPGIDTAIIARGGGSFEDLFPFSNEAVVRAIHQMQTPIISSVGHETDTTLADLVADLRAPTPTAAAEQATPVLSDVLMQINQLQQRLYYVVRQQLNGANKQLSHLEQSPVFQRPERLYAPHVQQLDWLNNQLLQAAKNYFRDKSHRLAMTEQYLRPQKMKQRINYHQKDIDGLTERLQRAGRQLFGEKRRLYSEQVQALDLLSPLKILTRGYALPFSEDEKPLSSVSEMEEGQLIALQMEDGTAYTEVKSKAIGKYLIKDSLAEED